MGESGASGTAELGYIEPCKSQWASPIVAVGKKDGNYVRVCIDYRKLNSISASDPYQMPRVDEMIDKIGKAKFITTLDLTKGYYQVIVRQNDRDKTAFLTPFGKFRFTRMPFGLKGAPTTFQRLMDVMLQGLEHCAAAYIDDIVIFSDTWSEHLEHLKAVLQRLRQEGLRAKAKKCHFAMAQCSYLGHVVGQGRVAPEACKVEAVQAFAQPDKKGHSSLCRPRRLLQEIHSCICRAESGID